MMLACAPPPMAPVSCVGCSGGVVVLLRGAWKIPKYSATLPTSNARGWAPTASGEDASYREPALGDGIQRRQCTRPRDQSGEWKVARVRAARSPAAVRHASDADRHRAGVGKTPGEDVRDWSRGEDARAFSPGGSEIRRLRDLTSKSRAWVRACASASGPPHGPTPHRLGTGSFSRLLNAEKILDFFFTRPHWPRQGFKKKPALYGFGTPPAGRYFGRNRGTKNIQRPGKEIRFSPEISAIVPRAARAEGEPGSVYFRSWLATTATDRESRASRVHDPPLAQRTRFPRSARRSDPLRRAIRWTTRRTRLSAPSARGRRATPHRG